MEILDQYLKIFSPYFTFGTFTCALVFVIKFILASSSRWSEREQSYYTLLQNLGNWQNSLSDRLEYYQEPGSWDKTEPETPKYQEYRIKCAFAHQNIREQISIGRIFLSEKAKEAIEELLGNYWFIAEHRALTTADYLEQTYKEVQKTYDILLQEAKNDLSKNRRLKFMQKLFAKEV